MTYKFTSVRNILESTNDGNWPNFQGVRSRRLGNTREYAAICVDMEGASTSKERRKEIRRGRTKGKTQPGFQGSMLQVQCHTNDDGLFVVVSPNKHPPQLHASRNPYHYLWTIFPLQCKLWINFPFFQNGKRTCCFWTWKQHLIYKNNLSSFWKN